MGTHVKTRHGDIAAAATAGTPRSSASFAIESGVAYSHMVSYMAVVFAFLVQQGGKGWGWVMKGQEATKGKVVSIDSTEGEHMNVPLREYLRLRLRLTRTVLLWLFLPVPDPMLLDPSAGAFEESPASCASCFCHDTPRRGGSNRRALSNYIFGSRDEKRGEL